MSHFLQVSVALLQKVTILLFYNNKKTLYMVLIPKRISIQRLKKNPLKNLYQLTVTDSSKEQPQTLRVLINILDVS